MTLSIATRAAIGALLLFAAVAALLARDYLHAHVLETFLSDLGQWAPLMFVVAFALGTAAFIPGSLFGLAGGVLFGPAWGALLNLIGGTLGATIAFMVARYAVGDWVQRRTGHRLGAIMHGVETEGWRFVALTRLVPIVPFNLLNYALGLTRISTRVYVITTLVCIVPGAAAYAWAGHAGRQAFAGEATAITYGFAAIAVLALVAFLPRLVRSIRATLSDGSACRNCARG
jgi:uncharacterized membrane protein YdjX (TVP38/TMEM64 family)